MGILTWQMFGSNKVRWIKAMVLGGLAFFLFWEGTYTWLTGTILNFSFIGIVNIPAKILAIILALFAWEAKKTG